VITGTNGDDTLIGNTAYNIINGLGGNDRINGCGGNDIISGAPADRQYTRLPPLISYSNAISGIIVSDV
jgi:Ca2+-binding RTX toxin-like protein